MHIANSDLLVPPTSPICLKVLCVLFFWGVPYVYIYMCTMFIYIVYIYIYKLGWVANSGDLGA